jgi:hypothetical protein
MLILPLPSMEMSLPLITIEPSFFIVMLASPVVIETDSSAVNRMGLVLGHSHGRVFSNGDCLVASHRYRTILCHAV